jgi:hypothetical protein
MDYEVTLKVGQYQLDRASYLDVRLTDMGACISVCDTDINVRYTALIDDGKLLLGEVDELVRTTNLTPQQVVDLVTQPEDDDESLSCTSVDDPEQSQTCQTSEDSIDVSENGDTTSA